MAARRTYSDADRATALAQLKAAGWSEGTHVTARMARDVGIPLGTLRGWVSGGVACVQTADVRTLEKQAEEAIDAMCERVARKGLAYVERWYEHMGDVAPDGRMFSPVMTSVGIAIDKMRLLRDQSTGRIAVEDVRRAAADAGLDVAEVMAEVEAMLREGDAKS